MSHEKSPPIESGVSLNPPISQNISENALIVSVTADVLHPSAQQDSPVSIQARHAHELNFYLGMKESTVGHTALALVAALCVGLLFNSQGLARWSRDLPLSETTRSLIAITETFNATLQDQGLGAFHGFFRTHIDYLSSQEVLSWDRIRELGHIQNRPSEIAPEKPTTEPTLRVPPKDALIPLQLDQVESLTPSAQTDMRSEKHIAPHRQ